ncbi:MAG: trypsin-like peptidase domain-containing protein [Candidatus Competibacteraceae bacterium]|nr:trypsin-like peptidase domain-containing protein [Candidatus Competibacteraceae bacterium]
MIGSDAQSDIALLKIDAKSCQPWPSGTLTTQGRPMGVRHRRAVRTGTHRDQGYRQRLGRSCLTIRSRVYSDRWPINPGNSGGPLFDLNGKVVGINSQNFQPRRRRHGPVLCHSGRCGDGGGGPA